MRVEVRPAARVRWAGRLPRVVGFVVAAAVVVIAVASVVPRAETVAQPRHRGAAIDLAAAAVAEEFARVYLTFGVGDPTTRREAVARLTSEALPEGAGLQPARAARQRVLWTSLAGVRTDRNGSHVVVLVETTRRVVQLAVHVARDAHGFLTVDQLPALLAPPPIAHRAQPREEEPVADAALLAVSKRATANFIAGARANLLADLVPRAVVVVPSEPLRLRRVASVAWVRVGRRVAVTIDAADAAGTQMALRYELEVRRVAGRWLVSAIEGNPNGTEKP